MLITCICIFFIFVLLVALIAVYYQRKINNARQEFENNLKLITNTINSVRYGNLAARMIIDEGTKYPVLAESINRMVETIQDREKMILEFKNEITGHNIFLEALINSLSDGFVILDESFVIKKMTSVAFKLLGEDAEGKNICDVLQIDDKNFLKEKSEILPLKNNTEILLKVTLSELKFPQNLAFKYLVTINDVSKEEELQSIKNNFVATLAHDLKVPLLAEHKALNLLKEGKLGEISQSVQQGVNLLIHSNQEMLELTDTLLDTYKIEEAGVVLSKNRINVNELIKEVAAEMKPLAIDNNMQIELNLDADFDFMLDEFNIKRVLRNLINNSVSYAQNTDKIVLFSKNNENGCYITIRDFGMGISDEEQKLIFQKFYSSAQKFRKVGHGLGLYLSYQIVKAHGGMINIISEPNIKTDFEIFLPYCE